MEVMFVRGMTGSCILFLSQSLFFFFFLSSHFEYILPFLVISPSPSLQGPYALYCASDQPGVCFLAFLLIFQSCFFI